MGLRTAGQIMSLNFNIYSLGAGAAPIGRAERSGVCLVLNMSWERGEGRVIVTLQSSSSGPQYAAKTKPIYCLGRGAVGELIFNAEMS